MFSYQIKAGTTDVSVVIRIVDSTDGTPETGVVFNTAGIDIQYRREGAASTAITEATLAALTTAHTDGGFLHIGNGYYRLDLPDAACASGVTGVLVHGTVTGMVVIGCYIQLVAVDLFDSVRAGLTALPNAAADGAGGLPISDAGGLDVDAKLANTNEVTAARMGALTDWIDGGRLDLLLDAIKAVTDLLPNGGALNDLSAAQVNAEVDTALNTAIPVSPTAGSVNDVLADLDAVLPVTTISSLTAANVNTEVVDVLETDTHAEASGVLAATSSLKDRLVWLSTLARNKVTQTATTQTLRNDADSGNIATSTLSDDGTTFTRGEWL